MFQSRETPLSAAPFEAVEFVGPDDLPDTGRVPLPPSYVRAPDLSDSEAADLLPEPVEQSATPEELAAD